MNPRNMQGSWKVRRRIIFATLALCAAQVVYLTIWGEDTRLAETLANGAYLLAGSVIGAYVFGAAWEDIRMKDTETYGYSYPMDDRPR
jgi:hypothetical protein